MMMFLEHLDMKHLIWKSKNLRSGVESSRSYKHLYPDVPVFQHVELAES